MFREECAADYMPFLFPEQDGLIMLLGGYFDESARREGNEPICVAGFVYKPSQYKRFCRYWRSNVLKHRGRTFNAFHMTDLVAGRAEYEGLAIADRLVILNHAIEAVRRNATAGIAIHFSQAEFEAVVPEGWADVFGSIYTVACGLCLQATGYWLGQWGHQMDVLYVFERGHKFAHQANEFLHSYGADEETRQRCKYRNHVFEAKSEPGLQSADLCAWIVTRSMLLTGTAPRALRPFAQSMYDFAACLDGRFKLLRFEGDKLQQFVNETLSLPIVTFPRKGNYPKGLR